MTRVHGAVCAAIAAFGPTATMRSPAIAIAWAMLKPASTVMILPPARVPERRRPVSRQRPL